MGSTLHADRRSAALAGLADFFPPPPPPPPLPLPPRPRRGPPSHRPQACGHKGRRLPLLGGGPSCALNTPLTGSRPAGPLIPAISRTSHRLLQWVNGPCSGVRSRCVVVGRPAPGRLLPIFFFFFFFFSILAQCTQHLRDNFVPRRGRCAAPRSPIGEGSRLMWPLPPSRTAPLFDRRSATTNRIARSKVLGHYHLRVSERQSSDARPI